MSSNSPRGISTAGTPLPSSFDGNSEFYEESRWQKLSRRFTEEPLIPLGCVLTSMALLGATRAIRAGDHNRTQRMFRARIAAQGFTLVAMVAGSVYWQTDRQKRKEFDAAAAERKAREKNEAWIRELEARDEEEREIRAMREARRKGIKYVKEEMKETPKEKVVEVKEPTVTHAEKAVKENLEGEKKVKGIMDSVIEFMGGKKS